MEPAFPPGMLMFSHLPPVTSFGRLPGGSALLCEEISLKQEPSSPPHRSSPGGYRHIKQEAEAAFAAASGLHGGLQQQIREQLARDQEQQVRQQLAHEHREQLAQQRVREQLAHEQQAREQQEHRAREQQEHRAREQISLQEQQQYRLYNARAPQENGEGGNVQVTVCNNMAQDLSLGKEGDENHPLPFLPQLFSRTERNHSAELKQNTSVKKARRSNSDSQEVKAKRKQSNSSKLSLLGEVDSGSLSPNQKPHICEHCNAAFRSSYHLRRHVLIHTGERPFQCSQCSMSFIQKYLLQRHEKIHSGEKPFSCDQCDMKFIQKYHMERHRRTHSGEKPYKCDTCLQYFSRTDRLLKHKRTCGDTVCKGGAAMDPGSSNNMDNLSGNFELAQGNASSSGRRKSKSKNLSVENKVHRSVNKINEPQMPVNSNIQNYAVEIPVVSSSSDSIGRGVEETQARVPKLVFKKVNRKNSEKHELNLMSTMPDLGRQKHSSKQSNSLELASSSGDETAGLLQSTSSKQGQNTSNYDDALQFLKKRRYLHPTNCNSAYSVNVGQMVSQQSVIQSAVGSVMDSETPLSLMESSSLSSEIKACHDKSGFPDEVLQSLLDHYTQKSEGQHEVPFSINEHHVDLQPSEHSQLVQEENNCSDSHSVQNDKAAMFYEYSKYLQQALERTSHSTSFPLGPSLQFVSLSSTLSNHTLFSDKQIYTTSPLECGFNPSITSVLPSTLPKPHFGMLVGTQPSFSLSALDSTHQQLTPSQELVDQVDPQKNLETSSSYQITSQELSNQKEQQKHLDSSTNFHLNSSDLDNQVDNQKNIGSRSTYQIENFAQAFGSQFKSGNRVLMAFNTNSNSEVDHRIRTSVSEFSGYSNILSDVSESGNARIKTSTSQSYR